MSSDWKPEVGKTCWFVYNDNVWEHLVEKVNDHSQAFIGKGFGWNDFRYLFPTPEAALASIKVYGLDGKEVVVTRDPSKNEQKMMGFLAKRMQSKQVTMDELMFMMGVIPNQEADAINKIMSIVYDMEIAPNPEGSARLKAAQERFASLAAGNEDPADPSARGLPPQMKLMPKRDAMLVENEESYEIDKDEFLAWCLLNENVLCQYIDSVIKVKNKEDGRTDGGC